MKNPIFVLAALGLCVSSIIPAAAQAPIPLRVTPEFGPVRQDGLVRIQSTINFFVPGPTNDSEEAQKLRDRAQRMVYETAAHQCDLLREVLAKDCRLESVNNNLNRPVYGQPLEGYNVNGQMTLVVTLKQP